MRYPLLFSEGRIGSVILRNRVVLPPLEVGMANFDGTPSEQLIAYYEERAKNGLGLLMTGITRVNERHGAGLPRQLAMTSDRHIEPFARMVERIHRHGTKIFCQLHHPGRQTLGDTCGQHQTEMPGEPTRDAPCQQQNHGTHIGGAVAIA